MAAAAPTRRPRAAQPPSIAPAEPTERSARRFEPSGEAAPLEACSIQLVTRNAQGRFCALVEGQPGVLAASPVFSLQRQRHPTPPEALRTLVRQLGAAGWRQTGVGRKPWELSFGRSQRSPSGEPERRP